MGLFPGDRISLTEAIKELSVEGYETSASQIRKLEGMGLISLNRSSDNRRELTTSNLERLKLILTLRSIELPLESIKRFLKLYDFFDEERLVQSYDGIIDTKYKDIIDYKQGQEKLKSKKERNEYYFTTIYKDEIEDKRILYKNALAEINRRFNRQIQNIDKVRGLIQFGFTKKK